MPVIEPVPVVVATVRDTVVHETLRLRPPFMFVARLIREPITLGEHHFSAGTMLMVVMSAVHRQAELYEDPESFRPERFLQQRPTFYGHIPFGGGEHRCLGDPDALEYCGHDAGAPQLVATAIDALPGVGL